MARVVTARAGAPRGVRIDPRAVDAAGLEAWGRLAGRAAEPNPFYRPEYVLANVIERGVPAELLVVLDEAEWLACLPVRPMPPTRRFPLRSLAALTDEYSFSGTPLIDRDALDDASDALIALIRAERRGAVVLIPIFESHGPVGQALEAAAARHGAGLVRLTSFQRAGWRRSAEPHFPGPAFNRSDRRELARRERLLSADLGGALTVVDRSNDPAAWEQFLALERTGWKAEQGTAMGSSARDAAFFRRMCAGMSAADCLEMVSLEVGGHTVAMECHIVDGDAFWSFKIAHDPAYRKYSPGTQLKYRVIDGLQDRPFAIADSCAVPENAHMNRLWPDRRTMDTVLLPTGSAWARLVPLTVWARAFAQRVGGAIAGRGRRRASPSQPD